jgi:hypothetical protein
MSSSSGLRVADTPGWREEGGVRIENGSGRKGAHVSGMQRRRLLSAFVELVTGERSAVERRPRATQYIY